MESSTFSHRESITLDFAGAFAALKADLWLRKNPSTQPPTPLPTGRPLAERVYNVFQYLSYVRK